MKTSTNSDDKRTSAVDSEMSSAYDPGSVETRVYDAWEQNGAFRPTRPDADPFTIIMPPPNLTGELHVGHALTASVEDALIRFHRMKGKDALWQPGVDHAAIAVNAIIERQLREEGLSRQDIGREAFLQRVWSFVNTSRSRIMEQHKRLGASADWQREAFTMDDERERAVRETFKRLYDDGLIYRGERIINWDPASETAVSDLEVEYEDVASFFWHVRYPIVDQHGTRTGRFIVVATTRPETIPADTAVAVHPDDDRFRDLVGRQVVVPTSDRLIPVITDEAVEIEGGSGALKVTPGHDPVDFEIGERHNLEIINILNLDGTLNERAGKYEGLDREEARRRVVADLELEQLIEKIEPYTHAVGHSERSGAVVEPLVSLQWWVNIKPLADPAITAVTDGRIKFVPERFERTYLHWMENIRDWCISRQIWWGHRIPVWYCADCEHLTVAIDNATTCESCSGSNLRQDEDTLDTWFSSGLWPHSTLGWPDEQNEDLKRFYPTQVMETGYDIIFFWVARMIMMSIYNMSDLKQRGIVTDDIPFEYVYLHGLVRAADGSKMSKSKGTSVDPLESIEQYGTDALRFALLSGTSPGNDQRLNDERLEAGRNFANKLWNASRFTLEMVESDDDLRLPNDQSLMPVEDRWILSRLNLLNQNVDRLVGHFELAEALRQLRDFFWDEFADWYIEVAKVRVRADDRSPLPVLMHVLDRTLRLLHPFMPFVSEEIWQRLAAISPDPNGATQLIIASYPEPEVFRIDEASEASFEAIQEFIRAIRNIRAEKRVDAGRWVEAYIVADEMVQIVNNLRPAIEQLARVRPLHIVATAAEVPGDGVVSSVLALGQVTLPMAGLFDAGAERIRIGKQIEEVDGEIDVIERKLDNEQFTSKAPAAVVQRERDRLETARSRLVGLRQSLSEIE